MRCVTVIISGLLLAVPGFSYAVPHAWGVWTPEVTEIVHVLVTPASSGTPNPHRVANFPREDLWLEIPGLSHCGWGVRADGTPISPAIVANSPDLNADLAVNLADVAIFAADFFGGYRFAGDFFWDGMVNLSDVPVLAASVGEVCP